MEMKDRVGEIAEASQAGQAEQSLSQRVSRGAFWAFMIKGANYVFGAIRTIILARLLVPSDFGLMAIAIVSICALSIFSSTGFSSALVQKKEDIRDYLDTSWFVSILRGIALFAILFFSAPLIARFFGNSEVTSVLRAMSVSNLFIVNIGTVYFVKELDFRKQFLLQFSGLVADLSLVIPLAFVWRSVWALVFGALGESAAWCVMSYVIHPYKPRLGFDFKKAKELFGFGKWILGTDTILFLAIQGDDAFIGKFLGTMSLGFYQIAYRFSQMPATALTNVVSPVMFPAYSKLQGDKDRLRDVYLKTLRLVSFVVIPLAGGIFLLAPEFTMVFLGDRWVPIIPVMRILVIAGLIRASVATGGPLYNAVGKPKLNLTIQALRVAIMAGTIYPLSQLMGLYGSALSVTLGISADIPLWLLFSRRVVGASVGQHLRILSIPLFATIVTSVIIFFFKTVVADMGIPEFLLAVLLGISIYPVLVWLLSKVTTYELFDNVKSIAKAFRSAS
jgi:lipopolysaccharide exporter